jgi:hypothetical protein
VQLTSKVPLKGGASRMPGMMPLLTFWWKHRK